MADNRNESLFADAANASAESAEGTRAYLGDPTVVEALLRLVLSEATKVINQDPTKGKKKIRSLCRHAAKVLLGYEEAYAPVPGWNEPGAIDEFAAKWLGSAEADPVTRLEHTVLKLVLEALDIGDYAATPGVLPEQWKWQLDAMMQKYVGVLMGIDLPTQALM